MDQIRSKIRLVRSPVWDAATVPAMNYLARSRIHPSLQALLESRDDSRGQSTLNLAHMHFAGRRFLTLASLHDAVHLPST